MNDTELRIEAIRSAVASGAKDVAGQAAIFYTFLTAGNVSASTSKPETKTEKPVKADAPKTDTPAKAQPSESDAPKIGTASATSPSDASGFAHDGAEITVADIRAAAVKYVSAMDEKALFKVLSDFGADKLSALEAKDYGAVLEKLSLPVATEGVFD